METVYIERSKLLVQTQSKVTRWIQTHTCGRHNPQKPAPLGAHVFHQAVLGPSDAREALFAVGHGPQMAVDAIRPPVVRTTEYPLFAEFRGDNRCTSMPTYIAKRTH